MMTQQLADARAAVEQSMVKVDAARSNLQTILDNLTAGVIVLGEGGIIRSSQPRRHPHSSGTHGGVRGPAIVRSAWAG